MITIDNFTIILSCVVVAVALLAALPTNPLFRRFTPLTADDDSDTADSSPTTESDGKEEHEGNALPKVSVIVVSDGTPEQMDAHISAILTQDYPTGFEVVAVIAKGDSATEDVLKRHALNTDRLYTTFVPGHSLFMSRAKLAVTIGVKAAHNEWVLVTNSRYAPVSDKWIATMAANCADGTDNVAGYTNYTDEATDFQRFERLREQSYFMRRALRSSALCSIGANLMFRKSRFISGDGFRGNLQFIQGEYNFLLNKYAEDGNTAVEAHPEAWLIEDAPSRTTWRNEHMSFINYRHKLNGIGSYRLLHCLDTFFMHAAWLLAIATAAVAAITQNWVLLGAAVLAIVLTVVLRTVMVSRASRRYEAGVPTWKAVPLELRLFWSGVLCRIRYMATDKHEFTSHKL